VDWTVIASLELKDCQQLSKKAFLSLFGILPISVGVLHKKYLLHSPFCHPRNILWTLYFSKNYPKVSQAALPFFCCNQTTFFEVVWDVLHFLDERFEEVIVCNNVFLLNYVIRFHLAIVMEMC